MDRDIEKVIFDLEGTIFQEKSPSNRRTLAKIAGDARVESLFAIRGSNSEVQSRAAIHRDEAPARSETVCNSITHGAQFGAIPSIVQQIGSDGEIIFHS